MQEPTMVVLSFDECVAECEAEMQMHVEIVGEPPEPHEPPESPLKAIVYWLNSHTGYFMAPSAYTTASAFITFHCNNVLTVFECVA